MDAGFTLIELLVTIAIAAVLMLVAVPNLIEFRRNAALSDAVGDFIASATAARAAALKSGRDAYIQANDVATGWRSGWIVFVDNNWNEQYDAGTDEVVSQQESLEADLVLAASSGSTLAGGYIRYIGSGFPRSKSSPAATPSGTLSIENSTPRKINIILEPAGRLRSCRVPSTGC